MSEPARVLSVDGGVSIPAEAFVHEGFRCWATSAGLARLIDDENPGELYIDGAFLTNERSGLSTEPDASLPVTETPVPTALWTARTVCHSVFHSSDGCCGGVYRG